MVSKKGSGQRQVEAQTNVARPQVTLQTGLLGARADVRSCQRESKFALWDNDV